MNYSQDELDKILSYNNKISEVISDFVSLKPKGQFRLLGKCPDCGKEEGLDINTAKGVFQCFKCGNVKGNSAISFLMSGKKMHYADALDYMNNKFTYIVHEEKKKPKPAIKIKKTDSFCSTMLAESGLTVNDTKATVLAIDANHTITTSTVFKSGSFTKNWTADLSGNDIIIEYYDLEGLPVLYDEKDAKGKATGKQKEFLRVRYEFPELHKDSKGKPMKYQSPPRSGSFIYIPDKIRQIIKRGEKIKRLFIQEGEKKAEKACKHGILSVAVSGIQNIAYNKELPADLVTLIMKGEVEEVCFLFDSDFNDLSTHLTLSESVDKRPRNFFHAARNFKEYMRTLLIRNIYVEIYIGHVIKKTDDKGIDDLLANTLRGKEDTLLKDIDNAMLSKLGKGEHVQTYKITSWTDSKLEEVWNLNNPTKFAQAHSSILKRLPQFKVGYHVWRFDANGNLESAQPIETDEQFWEESEKKTGDTFKKVYEYMYENALVFLQNRGFGRYESIDGTEKFCFIQHPVVKLVSHSFIRDYVKDFIRNLGKRGVLEMLHRGGPQYLGPDKLSDLRKIMPNFETPDREKQRLYFRSQAWEVTQHGTKQLEYTNVTYNIWEDEKHDFEPKLLEPIIRVFKDEDERFSYSLTKDGENCHFLQFLINASNFTWIKEKQQREGMPDVVITPEEQYENVQHLVSKLAAIGYLLLQAKDKSVTRAVVAMDGKQSEVGKSNGRTGKSLVGDALSLTIPSVYIPGKSKDMETDSFLWTEITDKTRMVFVDDVRVNFNFEFLFPNLTGDWKVNYKGGGRITIPFAQSPKIYIPTNHALNGRGSSFTARKWLIAFSDFYNEKHQPIHDFGCLFFDDWDFTQYNLYWNLVACCIQIYLQCGVVEAPIERIEARQLRQEMGESFLTWADEYFSDRARLNTPLIKKKLWDAYLEYSNLQAKIFSITRFKDALKSYCEYTGLKFNAHLYDPVTGKPLRYDKDGRAIEDDKSGGIEYVSLYDKPVNAISTPTTTTTGNMVEPANPDEKPF